MPQASVKLIWSVASCNFCPRSDVRTCQIKPGKLKSKLSSALNLDESLLDNSEGICTCCLADIDMIIRSVAIRGAMKDYFMDMIQNTEREHNSDEKSLQFNGYHEPLLSPQHSNDAMSYAKVTHTDLETKNGPPPPILLGRPSLATDCTIPDQSEGNELTVPSSPLGLSASKKPKERLTRYQCVLCDKIAGSKSHCMEHLICHSPVRPFTCSQCYKTYKSRKACREHLIVMHGAEKNEDNLQKLVLVDHDGLKQLEHVCTQYRKISSQSPSKLLSATTAPTSVKSEPDNEADGGSAWLFKLPADTPSRLPPPLLQCLPSVTSPTSIQPNAANECDPAPPAKRTRKSKPHKLIHSTPDNSNAVSFEDDCCDDAFESDEKREVMESNITSGDYLTNVNQPFFPSFQPCKIEPSYPEPALTIASRQSPTSMSKKSLPPCSICGRCFPTKEKVADHMRSHSEVKQFSCLVCNRFFKYRRGVTNHLKEVHRMTDRVEISSKVASHETGCIIPKSSKNERKTSSRSRKKSEKGEASEMSERLIQDTLSSLADIQQATDNAVIPQVSSDDSVSMTDADDSAFMAERMSSSPTSENMAAGNAFSNVDECSLPTSTSPETKHPALDACTNQSQWPTGGACFPFASQSGAINESVGVNASPEPLVD